MEQISIILMPREDGGLRIPSNDEPALILSGSEPEKVLAAVWPALAAIKKHRQLGQPIRDGRTGDFVKGPCDITDPNPCADCSC